LTISSVPMSRAVGHCTAPASGFGLRDDGAGGSPGEGGDAQSAAGVLASCVSRPASSSPVPPYVVALRSVTAGANTPSLRSGPGRGFAPGSPGTGSERLACANRTSAKSDALEREWAESCAADGPGRFSPEFPLPKEARVMARSAKETSPAVVRGTVTGERRGAEVP
jgi:hypothetical protein